jgi:hypothetical protein
VEIRKKSVKKGTRKASVELRRAKVPHRTIRSQLRMLISPKAFENDIGLGISSG